MSGNSRTRSSGSTSLPRSICSGPLQFEEGGPVAECHVLEDERRVITARGIVGLLDPGTDHGHIRRYLREVAKDHPGTVFRPIRFEIPGTQLRGHGYPATALTAIVRCFVRRRGTGHLRANHDRLAARCDVLASALLDNAIEDLVDSATGYDRIRQAHDSETRLRRFLRDRIGAWQRQFPQDVFQGYADLERVPYDPHHKPLRWGKHNLDFIYRPAVGDDVTSALKQHIPRPRHRRNLHQFLTDAGRDRVGHQITAVVTLMHVSRDMTHFRRQFAHLFRGAPLQLAFADL